MDRLTDNLNERTGETYHRAITAAMTLARKKMDRYYSLTDSSQTYRIAMVLHPGMKLEYFREREWEAEWIEEAKCLVREEYRANYEKKTTTTVELSVSTRSRMCELREYLSTPIEEVEDPLKWWTMKRHIYPNLHRMALDFLTIPGLCSYRFI